MRKSHTLGKLKKSGWLSRTVKQEIRENAIRLIREGEDIFPTVLGYQDTVCLLYTSPSPRDAHESRMPSSA